MIGGTRIDLLLLALMGALPAMGIFAYLSACIAAILFGPRDRPRFIRYMAWMLTPPHGPVEWFGLGVGVLITLDLFLLPFEMTTPLGGADYGPFGTAVLLGTYVPMISWLVYLVAIYRTTK